MRRYKIVPFSTGCFTGNLDHNQMEQVINQAAEKGWELERTIHETRSIAIIFSKETHFLIFSREA
ncbi:protein of unknown function (DUF4177) [Fodinibius salinus]|uniref:DUF4177 domain-containing protein n=1 Tax=Fodinibius salinus TaxID=860790 RepID=A0A5D3YN00_9BACT|nr:DUF4177 domain-containing protein [Fodinibius salinus]TYP95244.1 protein of unknown function (DUF4177) [Fodinibius salinus]